MIFSENRASNFPNHAAATRLSCPKLSFFRRGRAIWTCKGPIQQGFGGMGEMRKRNQNDDRAPALPPAETHRFGRKPQATELPELRQPIVGGRAVTLQSRRPDRPLLGL